MTTEAVTPDTAVETPATEAQPQEAPAQQEGLAPRDAARRALRQNGAAERAKSIMEANTETADEGEASKSPKVDEAGRKHDPSTGQYLPNEKDEGEEEDSAEAAASEVAVEDTATPPAEGSEDGGAGQDPEGAAEVAPGAVLVEVDDDHPVRQSLRDPAIKAGDEESARAIRALLQGTYVRRAEAQDAEARAEAAEARLREEREARIRLEASLSAEQEWKGRPEYQKAVQEYKQIRETQGQEAASLYWRGASADLVALRDQKVQEGMQEIDAEAEQQAVERWVSEAKRFTLRLPAKIRSVPTFPTLLDDAIADFQAQTERGKYDKEIDGLSQPEVSRKLHDLFANEFKVRLARDPSVIAHYQQANGKTTAAPADGTVIQLSEAELNQRLEQAKKEALEEARRKAADKREASPPNPLPGRVGAPDATVSRPPETVDTSEIDNTHDLKRQLRKEARQRTRAHLSG